MLWKFEAKSIAERISNVSMVHPELRLYRNKVHSTQWSLDEMSISTRVSVCLCARLCSFVFDCWLCASNTRSIIFIIIINIVNNTSLYFRLHIDQTVMGNEEMLKSIKHRNNEKIDNGQRTIMIMEPLTHIRAYISAYWWTHAHTVRRCYTADLSV